MNQRNFDKCKRCASMMPSKPNPLIQFILYTVTLTKTSDPLQYVLQYFSKNDQTISSWDTCEEMFTMAKPINIYKKKFWHQRTLVLISWRNSSTSTNSPFLISRDRLKKKDEIVKLYSFFSSPIDYLNWRANIPNSEFFANFRKYAK
jgi:hypothetical protein